MAETTGISWTDATWNPIAGCSVVSPGCTNCYAMAMAARIERMAGGALNAIAVHEKLRQPSHYAGLTQPSKAGPVWTGRVRKAPEYTLTQPLRWKKPRRIFVNSMSDLFHENVPDEWIDQIFAVMALAPQHTFQVLTKRSKRMREYLTAPYHPGKFLTVDDQGKVTDTPAANIRTHGAMCETFPQCPPKALNSAAKWQDDHYPDGDGFMRAWPLPNVWLGVTAEDQTRADDRIPDLLATPAAKRFVSIEPMLGPINLRAIDISGDEEILPLGAGYLDRLEDGESEGPRLDWVIVGGESGPNARPMHPAWPRALRDQCAAAAVPFFFKQHGEWLWTGDDNGEVSFARHELFEFSDGVSLYRVGKRAAGDLLDGVQHHEFPRMP